MDGLSSAAAADMNELLARQRAAFLRDGDPPMRERRHNLRRLRQVLVDRREDIAAAISADFGYRARRETLLFELVAATQAIRSLEHNAARWLAAQRRETSWTFAPASNRVVFQPLGVIGVVSPWNYPVSLAITPLATALAAGNRVMLKPSEITPRTSDLLAEMLGGLFSPEQVAVVTGDARIGAAFTALPFDHLLFTGSTNVGRHVMRAAAGNLTPVTLELGGKSPAVVQHGSNLRRAARRIAYGKLANAGQTCIAPDYAMLAPGDIDAFVAAYRAEVERLYPGMPANPDYSAIVSDRHHQRLCNLRDDAIAKGARIVEIGSASEAPHPRIMRPSLVLNATPDMAIMQEEIFGPLLPVIPYARIEDAIDYINARPRPLALYWFGGSGKARDTLLANTRSGGVGLNECNMHYAQDDLPFGGVGESGMGAYHGPEGVRTMSHGRAIFSQSKVNGAELIRPPFDAKIDRLLAFMLKR